MTSGAIAFLPVGLPRNAILAVAGSMLLLFCPAATAQESRPAANPSVRETAPAYQPGMLDSVGRWFRESYDRLGSNAQGARATLGGLGERASDAAKEAAGAARRATDAAKDAADAVARLPSARVVEARARCTIAANGAPDCRQAAVSVCQAKGFGSGSSMDIQSARKCPARVWLSGRFVRTVQDGGSYVSPGLAAKLLSDFGASKTPSGQISWGRLLRGKNKFCDCWGKA